MALKSRKLSLATWMLFNLGTGYGHQKLIESQPQLEYYDLVNNLVAPLFPGTAMTIRDAIVDKEELSQRKVWNSETKRGYSVRGKEVYLENIFGRGASNYMTSILPYIVGRLAAKII